MTTKPHRIRMHAADNVAIVANDGGLGPGARFDDGLVLRDRVPQGHKVALVDIPEGGVVRRYDVAIGYARSSRYPAGSWVHERLLRMPAAREPRRPADGHAQAGAPAPPLEGYTFEGYRNADGSVGTRNILAITQTVQCVAGVARLRGRAHPRRAAADATPTSTTWWRWSTATAAASRSTRPTR